MKIKTELLIVFFLLSAIHLNSQSTFNKRFQLIGYASGDGILMIQNDTITTLVRGTDINPFNYHGLGFARFDLEGNLLYKHFIKPDPPQLWQLWPNNKAFISSDKIYTVVNTTNLRALFVGLDKYSGEIVESKVLKKVKNGELAYYYAGT